MIILISLQVYIYIVTMVNRYLTFSKDPQHRPDSQLSLRIPPNWTSADHQASSIRRVLHTRLQTIHVQFHIAPPLDQRLYPGLLHPLHRPSDLDQHRQPPPRLVQDARPNREDCRRRQWFAYHETHRVHIQFLHVDQSQKPAREMPHMHV